MIKLTLCMIVKNEEAVLERCLSSVADACDEIIIVDTGSSDSTKKIALRFTDKVYDFEWIDDFSAARNFSFSKASGDYIMWLDADDIITAKDLEKLLLLKKTLDSCVDIVYLKYNVSLDEHGEAAFWYYRERIIKNCDKARFVEPVHEVVVPFGNVLYSDAAVTHKKPLVRDVSGGRNLAIIENSLARGNSLSPRLTYYYARELSYTANTKKAIKVYEKFLSMPDGWIENKIAACRELAACYRRISKPQTAVNALVESLAFSSPRPEIACDMGAYFLDKRDFEAAAFWYESALKCRQNQSSLAFIETEYSTFIPAIQLAVVYDRMGDKERAISYNEIAGGFKPNHSAYLYNKKYFSEGKECH